MTKTANFRRHLPVRAAKAVTLRVSGTVELSSVSGFATLMAAKFGALERKSTGVVLSELQSTAINRQRARQNA
jgi:hypothetical protein